MTDKTLIKEQFPYLYETHLHTCQGSACGHNTGAEMAIACKEAGYTGIIVTDHHWGGNTAIDRTLPWEDWVFGYCSGYEDAKKMGDQIGLDVWFGWEAGYNGTEFLIYGLDKAWMLAHPELREINMLEQYDLIHQSGGMVIHAHPFREENYIPMLRLIPNMIDGVEGINAAHSNPTLPRGNRKQYNDEAIAYAKAHNLPVSAGSDIHSNSLLGGGTAFSRKLTDIKDYMKAIMSGEDHAITDGYDWFIQSELMKN